MRRDRFVPAYRCRQVLQVRQVGICGVLGCGLAGSFPQDALEEASHSVVSGETDGRKRVLLGLVMILGQELPAIVRVAVEVDQTRCLRVVWVNRPLVSLLRRQQNESSLPAESERLDA